MTKDQALTLALEALEAVYIYGDVECVVTPDDTIYLRTAITAIKEALAQPDYGWTPERIAGMARLKAQQDSRFEPQERNFCPRCGKRLTSGFVEISIHKCTPPKEKNT
jgi:hypothetical protein